MNVLGTYHYYEKPLPISNISSTAFSDYINDYINDYVYLDSVKDMTYYQYGNAKNVSLDFLLYLKELSGNYAKEIRNVWVENFGTK